jgi:hypothetical protein
MQLEMAREREMRSGAWVKAVVDGTGLQEEFIATRVKKRTSTIYAWKKKGVEYLDWVGLLSVLGLLNTDDLKKILVAGGLNDDEIKKVLEDLPR